MDELAKVIQQKYQLTIQQITPLRKMIAKVFRVDTEEGPYLLKLYRQDQIFDIVHTFDIIDHLHSEGANTLEIIRTRLGQNRFTVLYEKKPHVGLLMNLVEGSHPDKMKDFEAIILKMKTIHLRMAHYPKYLPYLGQKFYVDRCIRLMGILGFDKEKTKALEAVGKELYTYVDRSQRSFCHGDYHNENLLMGSDGELTLVDFDASNRATYLVDVATICDRTNFNHFNPEDVEKTIEQIKACEAIYHDFSESEWQAIMAFIPIRHMELIATIAKAQGNDEISETFLEQQYDWILRYAEVFRTWLASQNK